MSSELKSIGDFQTNSITEINRVLSPTFHLNRAISNSILDLLGDINRSRDPHTRFQLYCCKLFNTRQPIFRKFKVDTIEMDGLSMNPFFLVREHGKVKPAQFATYPHKKTINFQETLDWANTVIKQHPNFVPIFSFEYLKYDTPSYLKIADDVNVATWIFYIHQRVIKKYEILSKQCLERGIALYRPEYLDYTFEQINKLSLLQSMQVKYIKGILKT